jgi:hypothetical protein
MGSAAAGYRRRTSLASRYNNPLAPDILLAISGRIGGTLTMDDLAETSEVGDWKMPEFKAACALGRSGSPGSTDILVLEVGHETRAR